MIIQSTSIFFFNFFIFWNDFLENILLNAEEMRQKYHREGLAAPGTNSDRWFEIPLFRT